MSAMQRLHPALVPAPYDRARLACGIVHLGLGAFQRAHMVPATEAAMLASGDLRWGTCGVSLRSAETRDALMPQQGLYALSMRDAGQSSVQVMHGLIEVLVAPENPRAVHEHIAHADTRIVSLTVTEKGYLDRGAGSTLDTLARGLALRHTRGLPPLTLLSLDNLPSNGHVLHDRLLAHVHESEGAALASWIEAGCTFPCSMVDRIVPRTTDADRERISAQLGYIDAWPVVCEPFFDWVLEDRFAAGRPAWEHGGVRFVDDAKPFETLKLRMVNGSHSAIAYLGLAAGFATVDRAIADPGIRRFVEGLLRDEVEPTLVHLRDIDLPAYRTRLLQRFANPALAHQTRQIAMDGSQKLPQRLLGTVRERLRDGLSIDHLALAVAAWIHHLSGNDVQDPLAAALTEQLALAAREGSEVERVTTLCRFAPVFGDLGGDPRFTTTVARWTRALQERSVLEVLRSR